MHKTDLKIVNAEAEQIRNKFAEVFDRANKNDAKPKDVEHLRGMLAEHDDQELWRGVPAMMSVAETYLLENARVTEAVKWCWREHLADVRKELGYADAPEIEKYLITHVSLCWLRLATVEIFHTENTKGSHTLTAGVYWDRRLSSAQRRFTRACVELARVRKLTAQAGHARVCATAASTRGLRAVSG